MTDINRNINVGIKGNPDGLIRATKKAQHELSRFEDQVEKADASVRSSVKSTDALTGATANLNKEIAISTERLRQLQLKRAQGGADSLFRDIGKERAHLKRLQALLDDVVDEARKAGGEAGRGFIGSLAATFQGGASTPILGPALVAALVTAAASAAVTVGPTVGGMLSGAVAAGFGGGALALGIVGAAKDPQVAAAAKSFGQHVMSEITAAGKPFVGPLVDSFRRLRGVFDSLHIGKEIGRFAPMVTRMADAVGAFVRGAWPGFKRALDQAGPALVIVAETMGKFGAAIGDAVGDMAESRGAMSGLHTLLLSLIGAIKLAGAVVAWLSDQFDGLLGIAHDVMSALANLADAVGLDDVAAKYRVVTDGLVLLRGSGDRARDSFMGLTGAAQGTGGAVADTGSKARIAGRDVAFLTDQVALALGGMLAAKDGAINWEEGLDRIRESVDLNGRSLSIYTDAGRANLRVFQDQVRQARDNYQANVDLGWSAERAAEQYNQEVDQIIAAGREAGYTREQLEKLAKDYYINIHETTYQRTVRQETERENRRQNRAGGGSVQPYRSYQVAEQGPEMLNVGNRSYLLMGAEGGYVTPTHKLPIPQQAGPTIIENHIEIGGEVVRVVRCEIDNDKRDTRRHVLSGTGAR